MIFHRENPEFRGEFQAVFAGNSTRDREEWMTESSRPITLEEYSMLIASPPERVRKVFSLLSGLALMIFLATPSCAQETNNQPEAASEKSEDEKKDPFKLPEKGDAAAYVEFIETLQEHEPEGISSQAEYVTYVTKVQKLLMEAGTKGLAQKPDDADQVIPLLRAKVIAIASLYNLGELENPKESVTLLEGYTADERESVATFAKAFLKSLKMAILAELSDEERQAFIDEVVGPIEKSGVTRFNFGELNQLAQSMENSVSPKEAAAFYRKVSELAAKSQDENVAAYAVKMQGVARRLDLPGNTMELFGKTAAGEDFNWDAYRGKVVLVDFWATWCGPCIQELPNVKANYEKYHEQGFEVVGVNLDKDPEQLEQFVESQKIPWVNLFPEDEKDRGWEHPLATHYGIMGIPATILVDQEGKVITLEARGPQLGEQLEKLLGKK
jgi:thiol-disulfide isomerase/thioredoxin